MAKTGLFIQGDKELIRKLQRLKKGATKIVSSALGKALTPINKAAKQAAPYKFGLLKKSIGKKVKTYRRSGTVVGMVGSRRGYEETIDGKKRDPWRYGRIVEFNTRFLETAFKAKRRTALGILNRSIRQKLSTAARRGR